MTMLSPWRNGKRTQSMRRFRSQTQAAFAVTASRLDRHLSGSRKRESQSAWSSGSGLMGGESRAEFIGWCWRRSSAFAKRDKSAVTPTVTRPIIDYVIYDGQLNTTIFTMLWRTEHLLPHPASRNRRVRTIIRRGSSLGKFLKYERGAQRGKPWRALVRGFPFTPPIFLSSSTENAGRTYSGDRELEVVE